MLNRLLDRLRGRSTTAEGRNGRPKYCLNEKALHRVFEYPDPAIPNERNLIRREAGEIHLPGGRIVAEDPMGDGSYPSYFGYDADGRVCCLVSDFGHMNQPQ